MNCEQIGPWVSELYDHQLIPGPAAEHISNCAGCRAQLSDYAEIGAELRLLASQTMPESAAPMLQLRPRRTFRWGQWRQGLATPLPIPRYAAVFTIVLFLALCAGFGLVEAQRTAEETTQQFQQALLRGDAAGVKLMLQKNAALANSRNDRQLSPLDVVINDSIADQPAVRQIIQLLLASGADVNARIPYSKRTPLFEAVSPSSRSLLFGTNGKEEIAALLLAHGADVNVHDWQGNSPLDVAVMAGNAEVAGLLRAKGALMDVFNAVELGDERLVSDILNPQPALVDTRDANGRSLVKIAATKLNSRLVQLLLTYRPDIDIFDAAASGQLVLVEKFLDTDSSLVNAQNARGMTPLFFAALSGQRVVAELLLARGANVDWGRRYNVQGPVADEAHRSGWITPLHAAASNGDREFVLLLLRHGADPMAHDTGGATPYHLALMRGHSDLAEELAGLSPGPESSAREKRTIRRPEALSRQTVESSTDILENERSAVGFFRSINTVEVVYARSYQAGFSESLNVLGAPPAGATPDKNNAGLVDDLMSGLTKGGTNKSFEAKGYRFIYTPGSPDMTGKITTYTFVGRPLGYGKSGKQSLFCDQTGVIRGTAEDREPGVSDPPLQ